MRKKNNNCGMEIEERRSESAPTMMSPGLSPAFSAGDPAWTEGTRMPAATWKESRAQHAERDGNMKEQRAVHGGGVKEQRAEHTGSVK